MNDGADIFWNLHMVAILQPFHMHSYVCVCKILGAFVLCVCVHCTLCYICYSYTVYVQRMFNK